MFDRVLSAIAKKKSEPSYCHKSGVFNYEIHPSNNSVFGFFTSN
ncbi:hypothetical protein Cha6605_0938 [Chamaesiphon minutus PCC 6605]|uniref:Uncharacterized protein n=1 Tax=Chamaesiphon minutus (strain ATCC 27169 / PCC 6605) TaxID=1173020 RepID=K9UC29_CHAP6|nr:hypothetical protein Cha6605_0938 [Chamaesiphon minutus PCC 6605]